MRCTVLSTLLSGPTHNLLTKTAFLPPNPRPSPCQQTRIRSQNSWPGTFDELITLWYQDWDTGDTTGELAHVSLDNINFLLRSVAKQGCLAPQGDADALANEETSVQYLRHTRSVSLSRLTGIFELLFCRSRSFIPLNRDKAPHSCQGCRNAIDLVAAQDWLHLTMFHLVVKVSRLTHPMFSYWWFDC